MRPFIFHSLSLSDFPLDPSSSTVSADIEKVLDSEIESLLSNQPNKELLPLVRLSVDITGFPSISPPLFGAKYVGRIANPSSLLYPRRKRALTLTGGGEGDEEGMGMEDSMSSSAQFSMMVGFIESFLKEKGGLKILNAMHMRETCLFWKRVGECVVSQFVNKQCSLSWHTMVQHFDQRAAEVLDKVDESNATVDSLLKLVKTEYEKENTQYLDALLYLCRIGITKRCDMNEDDANMEAEEDIDVLESAPKRRSTQYQSIHSSQDIRKRTNSTRKTK